MDLIGLLQAKNRCLQRLLTLSQSFTSETDEQFEELLLQREVLLRTITLFDKKIETVSRSIPEAHRADPSHLRLVESVKACLADREQLVAAILKEDDRIIEKIELRKAEVLKDMIANQKNSDQVRRFRSQPSVQVGESIDRKL